ncbi:MAG: hypothetical protein ACI4VC_02950 [Clostridia bacterium]
MADMSEILKNFSSMMEGKEIPDNIKEMLSSLQNNSSKSENNSSGQNDSQSIPNIDINTMLKMQKLLNTMNNSSNSSGANLLRSLKPYLKPSRQAKVDEYIQLFSIEKAIELMRQSDGDKKNDT